VSDFRVSGMISASSDDLRLVSSNGNACWRRASSGIRTRNGRQRVSSISKNISRVRRRQAHYSFLFMRANGEQLSEITSLIDAGTIRPVVDRVFPFASTKEAMAHVESGRAKGKVVVSHDRPAASSCVRHRR
jgi:NADPH:quinone reductase-like Zn-dependent oxidoreductase